MSTTGTTGSNYGDRSFEGSVYNDYGSAAGAVDRLHGLGYTQDDISVVSKDRDRAQEFAKEHGTKAPEGTVTGGVIGGALGAIIAGLTATGSVAAVVGTGGAAAPLVAGPLAAALAGLGAGGLAGGIIGALVGAGIPEDKAKEYEQGINNGGMLVGVHGRPEHREQLRDIFRSDTSSMSGSSNDATTTGNTTTIGSIDNNTTSDRVGADEYTPRRTV